MKKGNLIVAATLALFLHLNTTAQPNPRTPSANAVRNAEIWSSSFRNKDWIQLISLTYPGVVKYYGGEKNYMEYAKRANVTDFESSSPPNLELIQFLDNEGEMQCVIRKTSSSIVDGKKSLIISYLIGQSIDDGESWKFVDVSYNSSSSLAYLMPEKFDAIKVPVRKIIFQKDQVALGQ